MQYDFTTMPSREGCGSFKWQEMYKRCPDASAAAVPLTVADMELPTMPEVVSGLQQYLASTVMGYNGPTPQYIAAVQGWMLRHHGYLPLQEWFVDTPGIVTALLWMVKAYTQPGDKVLVMNPVYGPFRKVAKRSGCEVVETLLIDNGTTYDIDFADFAMKAADPGVKLCIISSPHNPGGRIWSREELQQMADICIANGVYLISDEIHADLILPGYTHVSAACLGEAYLDHVAICTAPSKTFNLAGFQLSNIFIPNKERREALCEVMASEMLGALSYEACRIAYEEGDEWLRQLLELIDGNCRLVREFVARRLPQVRVFEQQSTYLMWLDCRACGLEEGELTALLESAEVFISDGRMFGEAGALHRRINVACPRQVIIDAIDRLEKVLNKR
ncbi:MAG: PatB family C-S lyase [Firmicutes bacterium]|nr:PatB family C-S lyase [Bacillota bacterium]